MSRLRSDERGFTLVELLVVILIIGILAGIAIPAFLGQSAKAQGASAISALATAENAVDVYRTEHGTVCGASVADLVVIEPTLGQAPTLSLAPCPGGDVDRYTLSLSSAATPATTFALIDDQGLVTRPCAPAGQGGCHGNSTWGA